MVKLHVPFLFFLHTVRYQSHRMPRIEIQSKLSCTSLEKREWNGGIGVCAAKTTQTWFFTEALAVASAFLVQRSLTSRLGLSNLVARTEYHSRLALSTLILKFSKNFFVVKYFLPEFCILSKQKRLRLCNFLLLLGYIFVIIIYATLQLHIMSLLFLQCGGAWVQFAKELPDSSTRSAPRKPPTRSGFSKAQ